MISFERIDINEVNWEKMEEVGEANFFQTPLWLNFIAEIQQAEPVVTAIKSDGHLEGYFSGLMIRNHGLKILGSPFRGWGSYFMGFNLLPGTSRCEILKALPQYVFKELGCDYLEIVDPNLKACDRPGLPFMSVEELCWYALDLTKSEEEIFANMKSSCRNCIRKSVKSGVAIEEATDIEFADEYYAQFTEVMNKHGMVPTYDIEYLRKMIRIFLPTGNMLLLRARETGGHCIATGIFIALNKTAIFWGAASWQEYQSLRPNEPLAWYGIKNLKARGIKEFHFGGECEQYKEKYGCYEPSLLRLKKARNPLLQFVFDLATSPKNSRYRNWMIRRL
jgi:hypothetical protein